MIKLTNYCRLIVVTEHYLFNYFKFIHILYVLPALCSFTMAEHNHKTIFLFNFYILKQIFVLIIKKVVYLRKYVRK